jgi:itaconate CoA-transferase
MKEGEEKMYSSLYKKKLTTPEEAVRLIKNDDMLVHGLTMAEPPALLRAIASRIRAGGLERIKVFSVLPMAHACTTLLVPDLVIVLRHTAVL